MPRVTLSLKRATVRDVLVVMAEAHPPLGAMAPSGPLGRISLWTREAAAPDVRAAVLQAAGLEERVVEEGRLLERPGGNAEPLTPLAGPGVSRRLAMHPQELAVEEFVAGRDRALGRKAPGACVLADGRALRLRAG